MTANLFANGCNWMNIGQRKILKFYLFLSLDYYYYLISDGNLLCFQHILSIRFQLDLNYCIKRELNLYPIRYLFTKLS
jgi:hypothetical protein